jgi:cephalosporin-C deacetylase
MPSIDMPLEQLRHYKPSLYREDDFQSFWDATVSEAVRQPIHAELIPYDLPVKGVQCYAVRFDGYKGGRIAGWYVRPTREGSFPGLCVYHGYGGRGTRPLEMVPIASQGVCVLTMDCRGQPGNSQDASEASEGNVAGWMSQGIRDPQKYYYRYVYGDAIRALELLANRDEVDESRLAITGASQGGGLTLAVAALSDRPIFAWSDIPFLCDFRRAIQITPAAPYTELQTFLKMHPDLDEQVVRTLSYFDNMNLAPRIKCRTVITNFLWDDICPPSTIFAAYHHITAEKSMEIFPFHKHEVPYEMVEKRFRALMDVLNP